MAPPKTAAQQQADADALKEQNAAAERERDTQRQASMGDWLKNLVPDFSIMGLLEMAFFAFVLYAVAKTGVGQQALNWLTDKLDPDMQATVTGFLNKIGIDVDMGASLEKMDHDTFHAKLKEQGVPTEVLDIIDPNDGNKTLHSFLDTIRKANGGKVTLNGFTSPETIATLIQQQPEMTKSLLAAMKPKADGALSTTAQQMNASLTNLIQGPLLDKLLNTDNRANTISVLMTVIPPNLPINKDSIDKIISKGMDATGKATPELRQLFSDAVDPAKRDNVAMDVAHIIGTKDAPLLVASEKLQDPTAKYVVATLQQNPQAKAAYDALADKLGDEQAAQLLDAASKGNGGKALMQLLLRKENAAAIPQAVALVDALPELAKNLPPEQAKQLAIMHKYMTPERLPAVIGMLNNDINPVILASNFTTGGKFTMDGAVEMLLQPNVRAEVRQAGTANIAALLADESPLINQRNLDAVLKFADTLDTTNPNTKTVAKALATMVAKGTPLKEALKGLKGEQVAVFFASPVNQKAFAGLLDANSGIVGSTPAMQQELALLRQDYIKAPGVGLGAILSDAKSAQFLLDHADGAGGGVLGSVLTSFMNKDSVERFAMSHDGGTALANTQNQDIILELGKALSGVTTSATAAAAPTPAPAARPLQTAAR